MTVWLESILLDDLGLNRREFIQSTALGIAGFGLRLDKQPVKTHLVTLSFDDGFRKSFFKAADIYESFKLHGCFNVIATAETPSYNSKGLYGSFDDWNALKARGHEVMAHTYDHSDLTKMPIDDARQDIVKCAKYFESHLKGFKASESVYNFAYNASNAALDAFALTQFIVVRTQGQTAVNPIPTRRKPVRIGCWSHGPDMCDQFFEESINEFLASPGGWFVFNTHGLDGEGWGPMTSTYLTKLLKRLVAMDHVEVLPAGEVVLRLPQ